MPYLANKIGFINSFIVLVIAFAASYVLHLMIADLSIKTEQGDQIISCLEQFLFKGRFKKVMTVGFFGLLLAILFTNLTGYITGAEELIVSLIHVPSFVAKLIFYIIAAAVVFYGLKIVGMSESVAVTVIFVMVGILAVASFVTGHNEVTMMKADLNGILAYYGMAMFSMAAFFSVPQAVIGLGGDRKKIKKSIFIGFLNNFVIIVVINFCALLASSEVTEVGMIGWSQGIGLWAQVVGSIFIVLAMLTTYWSLSLALAEIVEETTKLNTRISWLIATLPSLILALVNLGNFMEIMRLAGGLISIVIAVMIVPAFINSKKAPGESMLKYNGKLVCAITIAAYVLMGIGSVVPV